MTVYEKTWHNIVCYLRSKITKLHFYQPNLTTNIPHSSSDVTHVHPYKISALAYSSRWTFNMIVNLCKKNTNQHYHSNIIQLNMHIMESQHQTYYSSNESYSKLWFFSIAPSLWPDTQTQKSVPPATSFVWSVLTDSLVFLEQQWKDGRSLGTNALGTQIYLLFHVPRL